MERLVTFTKESFKRIYSMRKDSWDLMITLLGIQEDPESVNEVCVDMNNIKNCSYK